jgi:hypothetical protein
MKKLIIILLFPVIAFSQKGKTKPDTCFTQSELADISFVIDSLWSADDINNELIVKYRGLVKQQDSIITLDSLHIVEQDTEIKLLKSNIDLYKEQVKLMQPKWSDKKSLWYGFGFLSALGSGILINQLIK